MPTEPAPLVPLYRLGLGKNLFVVRSQSILLHNGGEVVVHLGQPLVQTAAVLAVGRTSMQVIQRLLARRELQPIATAVVSIVLFDPLTHQAVPWPSEVQVC